jgi:hypothetical protein
MSGRGDAIRRMVAVTDGVSRDHGLNLDGKEDSREFLILIFEAMDNPSSMELRKNFSASLPGNTASKATVHATHATHATRTTRAILKTLTHMRTTINTPNTRHLARGDDHTLREGLCGGW